MKLFDALLHLYPSAFRIEYGDELRRVFAQRRRDVSGFAGVLVFWIAEFFDVLSNALQVHWDILQRDLHYTVRTLTRSPGFALTAIIVTALGIGANAAVFSVVDHVLIRPLPYADADRIVRLWQAGEDGYNELSPANFRDWQRKSTSFESMASFTLSSKNVVGYGNPEHVDGALVTQNLAGLLGVRPVMGRMFRPEEDRAGAPGTIVISYGMWQSRFGAHPDVLGQVLRLDGEVYTVIGVLPAGFNFPSRDIQFWIPFRFVPQNFEERDDTYINGVAKLKRGVALEQARAEMKVIAQSLEREYPDTNKGVGTLVMRYRDSVNTQSRMLLAVLLGASICVLLIACTNLANLSLVRAMGRARELAVRAALGAGRERLVRQLLTESLLLAFVGGIFGLILARIALPLLEHLIPLTLPIGDATVMNVRIFVFAALLVSLAAIGFGVIPALWIFGGNHANTLREGSRSGMGGRKERMRSILVVAEVTASVVLLISSGLLIRALWRIQSINPGFRTESVLTLETPLPLPAYNSTQTRTNFYNQVLSGVRALPQVSSAGYITGLPMIRRGGIWAVQIPGVTSPDPSPTRNVSMRYLTPGFFSALQIPIQLGRDVSESDTATSQYVAVVSASFAQRFWPGKNPLGHTFNVTLHDRTIVGVVGDVRVRGLEQSSEPQVYLPSQQVPDGDIIGYIPKSLVIRSSMNTEALVKAVRSIVQKADFAIPLSEIQTLQDVLDSDTAPRRAQIYVICTFAALSLLLAGIGIHGLLSFAVSQRSPEIGLRMALGARSRDILQMILNKGLHIALIGGLIGILLAAAAGRLMQALLAGIAPEDPAAFLVASGLVFIATLSGCLVPAFRASRIDPATVMRTD
jgi:putative ABC transport system permease protein